MFVRLVFSEELKSNLSTYVCTHKQTASLLNILDDNKIFFMLPPPVVIVVAQKANVPADDIFAYQHVEVTF